MMSRRSGQMLVITLWMIGLVSLAVGAVTTWSTHEMRLSRFPLEALQREAVAQAAVQQAIQVIAQDTRDSPQRDSLQEPWATGVNVSDHPLFASIAVGDGWFSVGRTEDGEFTAGLIDEERKLNIKLAAPETIQQLIELLGVDGSLPSADIAAALADWQDEPIGPWCDEQRLGYACHNGSLQTTDELRLVPGVTPELFTALEPYVTVYGGPAPNVNTADPMVLRAWGLTDEQVHEIVTLRQTQPFDTYPGLSVQSTAFTVPVEAWLSTASVRTHLQAVIDRDGHILACQPQ